MTDSITNPKKHLLRELYPYNIKDKKNAALRKGLKEYAFLLQALTAAAQNFLDGNLEKFDALVSENACQIRAIKIAILSAKKNSEFKHVIPQISSALKRLELVLNDEKLAHLMISNTTLEEVIETEKLDVELCHEELFLLQAFLLCEMKELGANGKFLPALVLNNKSTPKQLKKFSLDVSVSFTTQVTNAIKKDIAKASVNFVRNSAKDLNDQHVIKMTSKDYTREHNTLPCVPMFWGYKALLNAAKNESIPLVAHIQFIREHDLGYKIVADEFLFFTPTHTQAGIVYKEAQYGTMDQNLAACVFQGVVYVDSETEIIDMNEWKSRIENQSITDIILAVAADHKQYPSENIHLNIIDSEFDKYKSAALNNGFSINNPNTFFINHVFPMQLGRTAKLAQVS
jgi:hypothetical protein